MLSVVIPVRNGADLLPDQLAALAGQSWDGRWEVIVADNGSTDDLRMVVDRFSDQIPDLKIVDASDRPGQAHALNIGTRAATGDLLLFLDADDVVAPDYLSAMHRALGTHCFVAARLDCRSLNPPWLQASRPPAQEAELGSAFGFLPCGAGCSLGVRREFFDEVHGFDEHLAAGNDIDFCWRLELAGASLELVPDAVVGYRYRGTFRGIFDQARSYGAAGPALYLRYRASGMPRRAWRTAIRFHGALPIRLFRLRSRADVAAWVFLLGYRVGLVQACFQWRVVYL